MVSKLYEYGLNQRIYLGLDGEFDHFGIAEIRVKDGEEWKSDKLVKVATDGTTGNAIYISGFIRSKIGSFFKKFNTVKPPEVGHRRCRKLSAIKRCPI